MTIITIYISQSILELVYWNKDDRVYSISFELKNIVLFGEYQFMQFVFHMRLYYLSQSKLY